MSDVGDGEIVSFGLNCLMVFDVTGNEKIAALRQRGRDEAGAAARANPGAAECLRSRIHEADVRRSKNLFERGDAFLFGHWLAPIAEHAHADVVAFGFQTEQIVGDFLVGMGGLHRARDLSQGFLCDQNFDAVFGDGLPNVASSHFGRALFVAFERPRTRDAKGALRIIADAPGSRREQCIEQNFRVRLRDENGEFEKRAGFAIERFEILQPEAFEIEAI